MYTTKLPSSDSEKDAIEIGSNGEPEQTERKIFMRRDNDEFIYRLRVERAQWNRRIKTAEAKFKNIST